MEIANILPVNCINKDMLRQPYEMYLTHKVLEHPDQFAFLAEDQANSIKSFKILDNSACELGEGMDFDKVLQAAQIIKADEIVLPDIPRSGKSLSKTLQYLSDLDKDIVHRYRIAAVCQGETYDQVLACAEQILSIKTVKTLMLPKWYCSMESANGLGRHRLTKEILRLIVSYDRQDVQIHWLGLDTGIRELISPLKQYVRSVDSGYYAALATPQWSHLHVASERPRELKIDLEQMDVDIDRWKQLVAAANKLIKEA